MISRAETKVWPLERLPEAMDRDDLKVVMAVGCFDLLHAGHVRHLEEAAGMGDVLVVAVTCDRHVNKGPGRPAVGEADRALCVAALECVDFVFVDRMEPPSLGMFDVVRPDVYVKGREYEDKMNPLLSQQAAKVEQLGGRFVLTDCPELHTSRIIERIREYQVINPCPSEGLLKAMGA